MEVKTCDTQVNIGLLAMIVCGHRAGFEGYTLPMAETESESTPTYLKNSLTIPLNQCGSNHW